MVQDILKQHQDSAQEHLTLGALLWFTLSSAITITREKLEELMVQHEMPMDRMPKNVGEARAINRALRKLEKQSKELRLTKYMLDDNRRAYALTTEEIKKEDLDNPVALKHLNVIIYDQAEKDIYFNGEWRNSEIRKEYLESIGVHTSNDMRNLVTRLIYFYRGCAARTEGIVYFVPAEYLAQISRLQEFVKDLGGRMNLMSIINMQANRQEVFGAFKLRTGNELENIKKDIAKLNDNSTDKAVENIVIKLQVMLNRMDKYYELMEVEKYPDNGFQKVYNDVQYLFDKAKDVLHERRHGFDEVTFLSGVRKIDVGQ
jgi:hypothetical protein